MKTSFKILSFIFVVYGTRTSYAQSQGLAAAQALPSTTSFARRAQLYEQAFIAINAKGIDSGFTGAASDVCQKLSLAILRPTTSAFMSKLSRRLTQLNAPLIAKLLEAGTLGPDLNSGSAIDSYWVGQEQTTAEQLLSGLSSDQRRTVIEDMDANLWAAEAGSDIMSYVGFSEAQATSVRAANIARLILEATENRDPDYGNLNDRILIGKITCALNRKNDRIVSVCKHTETLMEVQAGDQLTFSVQGQVKTGANIAPCGPEGGNYHPFIAPPVQAPFGALIAKIGTGGSAKYFLVTDGKILTVPNSGTLRVLVNNGLPVNDTGAFIVSVSRNHN